MTIEAFWEKLKSCKSCALICHVRPDGDTLGSALALKRALLSRGVRADVFCDEPVPEKFLFLNGAADIKSEITDNYGCFVAVDCSEIYRTGKFASVFGGKTPTFNIDHHISNARYADHNCVIETAANCENIFNLIKYIGSPIDKDTATCLLTGISTDTGNFSHKNTDDNVLSAAAELVKAGAEINDINYRMFKRQTKARAKLFGLAASKIRYFEGDRIGVISVLTDDIAASGAHSDETEGFIDFLLGVDTVEIAVCVLETADKNFKVSFRSKGADVNSVAATFGGGGHILASGCRLCGYYEDVIDRLVYACKQHLTEL